MYTLGIFRFQQYDIFIGLKAKVYFYICGDETLVLYFVICYLLFIISFVYYCL